MSKLKKKIEDKVKDIIYKKAKEELEYTVQSYAKSFMDWVFSFFIKEETQEQKIARISKEIQEEDDVLLNDNVIGIVELYTLNYLNALSTLLGVKIEDEEIEQKSPEKIEEEEEIEEKEVESKNEKE